MRKVKAFCLLSLSSGKQRSLYQQSTMPALKSLSAAEEENDQLGRNSEADRFNPEAEERQEDPEKMDEEDEANVKRDQVEAEDEEALEEEQG